MTKKQSIKLKKFEGSIEEFIENIGIGEKNAVYLKKNKGTSLKKLWWENKEKWFCNWGKCKTTDISTEKTPWVISKDLPTHILHASNMNKLEMYLKSEK